MYFNVTITKLPTNLSILIKKAQDKKFELKEHEYKQNEAVNSWTSECF